MSEKGNNFNYLEALNPRQREAVEWGDGPILILAGAGSGKTRVLTYRIAHLIFGHGVSPAQIFAVTFTNKAAAEMRQRVFRLLDRHDGLSWDLEQMWISTFHSACVRILRDNIHRMGFSNQFTIYDDVDQRSVIKVCLKELNISDTILSPKAVQAKINRVKNDGVDSDSYQPAFGGYFEDAFVRVFERYTEALRVASALDFADLILKTVKLFQKCPEVLAAYQQRFPYLLIDEYQDTNRCQYLLMKFLAGNKGNICAVGDEDQSIYRWRGADILNILNFEKDYPTAKLFKLEQNYRSTKSIIEAASHVIGHNLERREKTLWTENAVGEKIQLIECYDEHDEAFKVISEITNTISLGQPLNEMAIFYRTNAQSRLFEDMLRAQSINYEIYGGLKFYERLEIKDALAYLRLIANLDDDVSFRRVVNVPARGIGSVSIEKLTRRAQEEGISLFALLEKTLGSGADSSLELGRTVKGLRAFYELVKSWRAKKDSLLPSDLISLVLDESGYRESLVAENTVESLSRLENLAELRQSVVEYELRVAAEKPNVPIRLEGFLEEIALVSDIDKFDPHAPALKLMTIHMAKGLEFDRVFLVGLEEELFPNIRNWEGEEESDVEEERRLFYVGMTRARKGLVLLYAKNRTVFGTSGFRVRSRFVEEIPEDYLECRKADYFSRRRPYVDRPGLASRSHAGAHDFSDDFSQVYEAGGFSEDIDDSDGGFKAGSQVVHPTFGRGVVKEMLGDGKLKVEFAGRVTKKISLKFCQLKGV